MGNLSDEQLDAGDPSKLLLNFVGLEAVKAVIDTQSLIKVLPLLIVG